MPRWEEGYSFCLNAGASILPRKTGLVFSPGKRGKAPRPSTKLGADWRCPKQQSRVS